MRTSVLLFSIAFGLFPHSYLRAESGVDNTCMNEQFEFSGPTDLRSARDYNELVFHSINAPDPFIGGYEINLIDVSDLNNCSEIEARSHRKNKPYGRGNAFIWGDGTVFIFPRKDPLKVQDKINDLLSTNKLRAVCPRNDFVARLGCKPSTTVRRLYNPSNGTHDYTNQLADHASDIAVGSVQVHGINFHGFSSAKPLQVKIDRTEIILSPVQVRLLLHPNSVLRYLTTSKGEAAALIKQGWKDRTKTNLANIFIFTTPYSNTIPPTKAEPYGFRSGAGCKSVPGKRIPSGTLEVYHLYNKNNSEHYYTSSLGECSVLMRLGWYQNTSLGLAPMSPQR